MTSGGTINRRTLGFRAAALAAAPAFISARGSAQPRAEKVTVQLGWLLTSYHVGDIAAKHLGFFEQEGLDVTFSPGGPSIDGLAMVASGRALIGQISSSPSIMHAVSQRIPISCFAVGAQRHPFAYFSWTKKPIRTPQDLEGKKVGLPNTAKILHAALLKKNGIKEDAVEVITVGADKTPLLSGQVDALTSWTTDLGSMKEAKDFVVMRISDYGVRLLALPYYASESTIRDKPHLLAGFVRAVARGWWYAKLDPEGSVAMLQKESPNINAEHALVGMRDFLTYAFGPETAVAGWGAFEPAAWQEQIALFDELKQFSAGPPPLEKVMTSSILEATKEFRASLR